MNGQCVRVARTSGEWAALWGEHSARVVYSYARVDSSGTNTQYMKLTDADLDELKLFLHH